MRRPIIGMLAALALVAGAGLGFVAANLGPHAALPSGPPALVAGPSPRPSHLPEGSAGTSPSASGPVVTPKPTPVLVPAPLTGLLVTPAAARQHVTAVMIDDLYAARPQSGLTSASVVFQAPAEGGIPRYMAIFQDTIPAAVGPVRSARYYFVAWASQWRSMYVHVGGSPQAMQTLASQGHGQLVYNADEFRYGGRYLWRIHERLAPHNVYTDGKHLRQLVKAVGARDGTIQPAWQFAPDLPRSLRPVGGRIEVSYPANHIRYDYDRRTNTYKRQVTGEKRQTDAASHRQVAPKNVVVMLVRFGPLNDGHPQKHRLEADVLGSGIAWIATNGQTIKGTWRKASLTGPLQFFDNHGRPATLTAGQTFVQIMKTGTAVTISNGHRPPASGIPTMGPRAE